jgi:putative SOS response-associated peptidase YedK
LLAANIVVFCTIGISAAQCEPVHTCHSPPMLFIRESRCLVPANSFAEYAPEPNPATGKKDVVWFALDDDRPPFAFGGLWTEFRGDRGTKSKPIPGPHLVYGFLTTTPLLINAGYQTL